MARIVTTAAFFVALTAPAFATPAPAPELGTSAVGFLLASGVAYLLNRRASK